MISILIETSWLLVQIEIVYDYGQEEAEPLWSLFLEAIKVSSVYGIS